ncbi:glycosyltransferase, family 1 [Treponema primitia ZAS-2]|uniref:Glycosyltransferase, family 1 n=1 Tax=Treponema primitia (strain ATCC BAA-887 / DSM 12427 / ZAS-2) TaxID=545694 RepID=F5YHH4_TREPZ|nr:glycosyltransferase [Treponema primitia]AEF84830.1 glycosyltransferase, family 1 [Treponema primitia ZAS-2]
MKVAIVHYWLVNMRGGEKVLEVLLEMFPQADIFTHVYDRATVSDVINSHPVYTSSINKLPFAKKLYQKYMPLMPKALMEFDLQDYDLIISSESGPAKGVVPNPDAYHICYCHSPMRYLWDMYHGYFRGANPLVRFFMSKLIPALRLWDVSSANLVDRFIANSSYVAKRIERYYNRKAAVVYPPVAIEKYLTLERKPEDFYLFFGQLTGYKRADIAIEACVRSGRKLVVAGAGAKSRDTGKYKKSKLVTFTGRVSDEEIRGLYSRAKALLFPGIEDFGIVPVEANAAGCPVIAFRKGGVLDTVKENGTGLFFDEQSTDSLIEAMDRFESCEEYFSDRKVFTEHVQRFSREAFVSGIRKIIEEQERV